MELKSVDHKHIHTHTPFNGPFSRTTRVSPYQKGKPIWILLKQETVSNSGISWAICKSAPCTRQITTPAPHHSVFYRPDALPAAQPTASKHRRRQTTISVHNYIRGVCVCTVQTDVSLNRTFYRLYINVSPPRFTNGSVITSTVFTLQSQVDVNDYNAALIANLFSVFLDAGFLVDNSSTST